MPPTTTTQGVQPPPRGPPSRPACTSLAQALSKPLVEVSLLSVKLALMMGPGPLCYCYSFFFAAGCWTRFAGPSIATMTTGVADAEATPPPLLLTRISLSSRRSAPPPPKAPLREASSSPGLELLQAELLALHSHLVEYAEEVALMGGGAAEAEALHASLAAAAGRTSQLQLQRFGGKPCALPLLSRALAFHRCLPSQARTRWTGTCCGTSAQPSHPSTAQAGRQPRGEGV